MAVFKCGGQWVLDDSGNKACDYESEISWRGKRCPGCACYYDVRRIGAVVTKDKQKRWTAAELAKEAGGTVVKTGLPDFDRVMNGGLELGCATLIGGSRGVGKTTLLIEVCDGVSKNTGRRVLYASGEETAQNVGRNIRRIGVTNDKIEIMGNENQEANNIDTVLQRCKELKAALCVFDSIQAMTVDDSKGNEGSPAQINAVANMINSYCKENEMAAIIITHLEKQGEFAGTETLQHYVDTLLRLDRHYEYNDEGDPKEGEPVRVLECHEKNRLGPSGLKAYYEMTEKGLKPVTKSKLLRLI
jgi:DNA repair protein RadA/Sms